MMIIIRVHDITTITIANDRVTIYDSFSYCSGRRIPHESVANRPKSQNWFTRRVKIWEKRHGFLLEEKHIQQQVWNSPGTDADFDVVSGCD